MVEGYAMGRSADELCAEMLRVLGEQATTKTSTPLRVVENNDSSPSDGEI